ncbi:MAG: bifunctional (p)ppGpp synthetase/guanosine-3',5'-bis(diphosphate) 3'-pyrophosphohydrolase [Eubacterium sp.]|jgi:GTP pyrophosphokinase|nr:bifunctional (p)ppGpp synthetase/guanosine-3',5'-bis(diphosphate) 3'-pyrophosphohydrolase [Eubacterium sp.]
MEHKAVKLELLMKKISDSGRNYDTLKIREAYKVAERAHDGQLRRSGELYITHPAAVADILLDLGMDSVTICSALLHDVVEDTDIPLETIRRQFGADVAMLVDGVTEIGKIPLNSKEETQAENIRKILLAMSHDIRVMIIKLADRLHNMRTLGFREEDKQRSTSSETMNFYAPIAHRLGMNDIKEEMEELALKHLDPFGYDNIEKQLSLQENERESFISTIKERIMERISFISPSPIIEGRVKGVYSIYKKVYIDGKDMGEIYDIFAVRIILQTIAECYTVLGIIHDMFRPIPYRLKDYIATPKPNLYRSLHTTVIAREGVPFEVQIRTADMHHTALYGVAAHWKYKAGISGKTLGENRLEWIHHILEQQQEADDVEQIAEAVRIDLASDEVLVFTPKGDVVSLPMGSTVIDFAYSIHTQVGNKMTGAKVGGRMVKFDHKLKTGEIIEIITTGSENYGPNLNWVEIAKTTEAKAKIRAWHKRENREKNINSGKKALNLEFKKYHIPWNHNFVKEIAARQRFEEVDDFYAAIGYGGVSLSKIMQRVKYEHEKAHKNIGDRLTDVAFARNILKKQSGGVTVEGEIKNCSVKYAQCCNPLPGDEIIGFVTLGGHGISIHKVDCHNVLSNMKRDIPAERWVGVSWNQTGNSDNGGFYRVTVDIIAEDRKSLIADITTLISENKLSITEINAHFLKNGNANVIVTFEVAGVEQLNGMTSKIKKLEGVMSAERTGKQ